MSLVVQNFGGTSVGTVERIRAATQLLAKTRQDGNVVITNYVVEANQSRPTTLTVLFFSYGIKKMAHP